LCQGKRFEDLDDEESYQQFRLRERRGVMACDYGEVYGSMAGDHGRDVLMQRAVMVNWIMEVSVCHSSCDLHSTSIPRFYFRSI
jgi:hypothetical protein